MHMCVPRHLQWGSAQEPGKRPTACAVKQLHLKRRWWSQVWQRRAGPSCESFPVDSLQQHCLRVMSAEAQCEGLAHNSF